MSEESYNSYYIFSALLNIRVQIAGENFGGIISKSRQFKRSISF